MKRIKYFCSMMLLVLSTLVLFACGAPNNVDAKSGGFTDCSFTYPEITMELGDSVNIFDVNPVTYSPSNLDVRIVYEIADNNIVDLSGNILHAVRVDNCQGDGRGHDQDLSVHDKCGADRGNCDEFPG